MEELKPLSELTDPDERQRHFAVMTGPTSWRAQTLEDVYKSAEQAHLHLGVPPEVRLHFAMAQNLVAYSWFCYPFNVAAEFHAYASVELALKVRYPNLAHETLQRLLDQAMSDGLPTNDGFTHGRDPDRAPYPPSMRQTESQRATGEYAAEIAQAVRHLRNALAHGEQRIHMKGGSVLLACSELINQLFPRPSDA